MSFGANILFLVLLILQNAPKEETPRGGDAAPMSGSVTPEMQSSAAPAPDPTPETPSDQESGDFALDAPALETGANAGWEPETDRPMASSTQLEGSAGAEPPESTGSAVTAKPGEATTTEIVEFRSSDLEKCPGANDLSVDTQASASEKGGRQVSGRTQHGVWLDGEGATDGVRLEFGYELETHGSHEQFCRAPLTVLGHADGRAYRTVRLRVYGIIGKPDEKKAYGEFSTAKSEGGLGARLTVGDWYSKSTLESNTSSDGSLDTQTFRDSFHAADFQGGVVLGGFEHQPVDASSKERLHRASWSLSAGYRFFTSTGTYAAASEPPDTQLPSEWRRRRPPEFFTASTNLHAFEVKLRYSRVFEAASQVAVLAGASLMADTVPVRVVDTPSSTPKMEATTAYTMAPKAWHNSKIPLAWAVGLTPSFKGDSGAFEPVSASGTLRIDAVFYMFARPFDAKIYSRFGLAPFLQVPLYGTDDVVPGVALRVRQSTALLQW